MYRILKMKKKILGATVAIAIAAMVTFNLHIKADSNKLSALTMSNVEALADGESGSGNGNCQKNCKVKLNYLCITTNGDNKGYKCAD